MKDDKDVGAPLLWLIGGCILGALLAIANRVREVNQTLTAILEVLKK